MKKYYGVLIALIPFITGSYKSLGDWSTSEMAGYNTFSLALIGFGVYFFIKHKNKKREDIDLAQYDIAVFKIKDRIDELWKNTDPNTTVKQVSIKQLTHFYDLCTRKRNQNWKSQKRVDDVVEGINEYLKSDKDLGEASKNINI